jgi:hypothetical protein
MDLLAMSGDSEKAMADIQALKPVTTSDMTHHLGVAQKNAHIAARGEEAPPAVGGGEPSGGAPTEDEYAKEKAELSAIEGVEVDF